MKEAVKISLRGRDYEVKYPTVGQYCSIESLKQSLSGGNYGTLIHARTQQSLNALDMIDIQATLAVLTPKLFEDLKVTQFSDLGLKDYVEIRDQYTTVLVPFLKEIEDDLSWLIK